MQSVIIYRRLKEKRKTIQEGNVKKKQRVKEELHLKSLKGMQRKIEHEVNMQTEVEIKSGESDVEDDAEWYRKEVGEEPEKGNNMLAGW